MNIQNLATSSIFSMLSILAISFSNAVIANVDAPRIRLDSESANELGILIKVENLNYELMDNPSPLFIQLDLTAFGACKVRDVGMDVRDAAGTLIFGTGISSFLGARYPFRLDRQYVKTTVVFIACDEGPDIQSRIYQFTLGNLVQIP